MKIVVNKCFGGFGLSVKAVSYLEENHNVKVYKSWDELKKNKQEGQLWAVQDESSSMDHVYTNADEFRTDERIIEVVEKLGDYANGMCAGLEVLEIPDDIEYEIDDYDGIETIRESHRSW